MDQAGTLRHIMAQADRGGSSARPLRTIAVTSGKGGVGKTSVALNLGIALAKMGRRVVLMDADLGMANVDVFMGVVPHFTLAHVVNKQKEMAEIIVNGPYNLKVLPGGSGLRHLADLGYQERDNIIKQLNIFNHEEFLIIDTGAGISRNVIGFLAAADEVLVVVTPDPASITDAYGVIKILAQFHLHARALLLVNRALTVHEARQTESRLLTVTARFLDIALFPVGYILEDSRVTESAKEQKPLLVAYPHSKAAGNLEAVAALLAGEERPEVEREDSFVQRLLRVFRR